MRLGENIERLRRERNWSRQDLGAALGENPQEISRWESGKTIPGIDRLVHMSLLFEIPLQELAGDQAGVCDLQQQPDPKREAAKQKKDRFLMIVKCAGVCLVILLAVIVNLVWLRFMRRFIG